MSDAGWALQQSVFSRLTGDGALVTLLGGPSVHDDVPPGTGFPYLTLGQSTAADWSTATEPGLEHVFTVHVWSRAEGRRQTHELIGAIRAALEGSALAPAGHALVNLGFEFSEARRDPDGETYHGIVRYRAVTEPA
jgi:hypothetical protein